MNTYIFLQHYWWFIVSLLGAILVFLLFVQGGNSLIFCLGKTEEQRKMIINSTGRKWEFTFTTLVTFGGAFFASFPLFYSTSFGGAYWLWMIILFTFVLQAVSYEFQSKAGNLLGKTTYRAFLVINGVVGPVLLGGAVATFFTGSEFYINKGNIADTVMPVISSWANAGHGLDALLNPWNVVLGLAVFFLARILGAGVAGGGGQRGCCATDEAEPNHHLHVVSGICQNSGRHRKAARQLLQTAVGDGDYQFSGAAGADGDVE